MARAVAGLYIMPVFAWCFTLPGRRRTGKRFDRRSQARGRTQPDAMDPRSTHGRAGTHGKDRELLRHYLRDLYVPLPRWSCNLGGGRFYVPDEKAPHTRGLCPEHFFHTRETASL